MKLNIVIIGILLICIAGTLFFIYPHANTVTTVPDNTASDISKPEVSVPDFTVSGIMKSENGRQALVNGELYRINDIVDGYTIIAIDPAGIRVEKDGRIIDLPLTTISSSDNNSSGDDETGGVFSKWKKTAPKPAVKATPAVKPPTSQTSSSSPRNEVEIILSQKMHQADNYFSSFKSEATELLRRLPSNISNSQAASISREFQQVVGKYQNQMNALQLPGSATPAYDSWASQRRKEENDIISNWNKAVESKASGRSGLKVQYN